MKNFKATLILLGLVVSVTLPISATAKVSEGWQILDGQRGANAARMLQDKIANTAFADCKVENRREMYGALPSLISCPNVNVYGKDALDPFTLDASKGKIIHWTTFVPGQFTCNASTPRPGEALLMKSNDNQPAMIKQYSKLDTSYGHDKKTGEHVETEVTYILDSTRTEILEVDVVTTAYWRKQVGTIDNPQWALVPSVNEVRCHAQQNESQNTGQNGQTYQNQAVQ